MSWKRILKNINFNPSETCCMALKDAYSKLLSDLQDYYDLKGIKLNVAAMSRRRMNASCSVIVGDLQSFYAEKGKEGSRAPNWAYYRISEILNDYGECEQEAEELREEPYSQNAPIYISRDTR